MVGSFGSRRFRFCNFSNRFTVCQFFTRLATVFAEEFNDFFYFSLINLFFTKRSIFIPYI